ncbi:hypothetical protein ASPACDRAFT_40374 [Aspergillus aculeatus ATCC 16872]|uniref:Uncharacterized protein n=1 Tax=Aspergillus aculeatus (strain ATCC 16872 / CBS 172.66 / WB 5094) TaxID=690307 RepID=A0A1L9X3K0_ASPA1|nr:uncharacterized protein ASPACDRAFT_40374 [Aspergillus aculeatus ATCC 16872]OJK03057.1 hypothetical protein ASPACDRAFT_40374 [Aspergillus aculeatus ATCC 16872]
MAPIRRYLRISKYTVLECRIYLEKPSDIRWLLSSRDPVLQRIFAAIRPLVLPKLREENERLFARKKGKPVKDVIAEDDFEVALFLRESRTRHSLLTRHKEFEQDANKGQIKLPAQVGADGTAGGHILVESDDESDLQMQDIPEAGAVEEGNAGGKRARTLEERDESPNDRRTSKRRKDDDSIPQIDETEDKKMQFKTNYEGFNIYGWVLCLLVTRKSDGVSATPGSSEPGRQVLMEEWISTQAQGDLIED